MSEFPVHFGVDYYPEHWPVELLEEDLQRITELGATMIRIGEFAWHLMEPREGEFDFTYFDHVLDRAQAHGLVVMFGTPTATFPAWLAAKHPSILSMDNAERVRAFGGRRQYCYNSPIYRRYAARITAEVVKHYASHPALVAWQVDNELGHEGSDDCYCQTCVASFQEWLTVKYPDIDDLNRRWGTIFWGQTYNTFTEIPAPFPTITTHNPSLLLDWMRFRSDSLNGFCDEMVGIIKAHRRDDQPVTHNLPGGFFGKLWSHAENVRDLDVVSYDNYPVWGGLKEPMSPAEIAMTLDFVRGLQDRNFWIVEQLMGAQGHDVIGYLPRPDQAKMWAYQAFGHGCELMLWFRYRGMTRGAEQFCFGIIDHDNRAGRKYEEVKAAIADLRQHEEVWRTPIDSDVAVLYDMDNVWSWRAQTQSVDFDFTRELMRVYAPFHALNTAIDVRPVGVDLSRYKVVAAPVLQVVDEQVASQLADFVEQGGVLILSFRTGIKNRDNVIHFGLTLPGLLKDVAGIEVAEVESLQDPVAVAGALGQGTASVWRDLIHAEDAEVLLAYQDPPYELHACVTRHRHGKGVVYYVGAGVDERLMQILSRQVATEAGLQTIDTPDGMEVCVRADHMVLANHTNESVSFAGVQLGPYGSAVVPRH
jgi:beta-galactosidase